MKLPPPKPPTAHRRYCPVCYRRILPTYVGTIQGHWDSTGRDTCPMSYEDYRLAKVGRAKVGRGRAA